MTKTAKKTASSLNAKTYRQVHPDDKFVVFLEDGNEPLVIRRQQAKQACRYQGSMQNFTRQLSKLGDELAGWLNDHAQGRVKRAYLTGRDRGLLFLVVKSDEEYDAKFGSLLSELDIHIATCGKYPDMIVDVRAIPPVDAESPMEQAFRGDPVVSFVQKDANA